MSFYYVKVRLKQFFVVSGHFCPYISCTKAWKPFFVLIQKLMCKNDQKPQTTST